MLLGGVEVRVVDTVSGLDTLDARAGVMSRTLVRLREESEDK